MTEHISKFKKAAILSTLCLGVTFFTANAQEVISLQEAVNRTLANNLTIKQAQVTEKLASEDYMAAKYNQLPSLNANGQGGYYFGKTQVLGAFAYAQSTLNINANAQAQVTLFQGGQLRNQIVQNKLTLDADKTNTAKIKNDLLLNVVTDYLTILTDQDLVIAAQQQIDLAKITLDRAQKNFDQGNATLADLAQAKSQVSTAELNLTNAQNQVDLAILVLKQYMEMDPSTQITVEKPDISKLTDVKTVYDATEVIKTAFTTNPDIKLAELQQQVYARAVRVAKGAYYPTLVMFGGLGSSYSNQAQTVTGQTINGTTVIGKVEGTNQNVVVPNVVQTLSPVSFGNQLNNNFNQSIGLSLQIPIFNHFAARTAVTKAKLAYQNAELNTQIAKNNLSKTIIQATLDLSAAEKSYQSALQTFNSNKEALNVTKQRYDAGFVNTLDYNTALTNFNKSQNDMIEAQYQVIFRSKVIDYYLGNPIAL
ncbi:TolC family protein [Mucilaginibacter sp. L3T2-6]|uniref:TolC family protein n=1 Tax=Mucilaginibacter sp. L3T2-6 TaxID=3062491 RepID=UPI002675DF03|nr:TolC family protein [Mucilaginibacter sp. L3T2-6]MDO3640638.1 TolC family protein [Mucilaginibacter sp. L3T2-6]MDV6213023.1 TolC family protein [Mucilaginibacter sp. L3T2-6]